MSARRWFVLLCVVFAAVVASGIADVPPRDPIGATGDLGVCDGPVRIDMDVVRASKGEVFIDPELRRFRRPLAFTSYDGFSLLDTTSAALMDGGREDFPIGLRRLRVDLVTHDDSTARVRLRLYGQDATKVLDTGVAIRRGRTFFVAGPKVGEDVLILPVTASW